MTRQSLKIIIGDGSPGIITRQESLRIVTKQGSIGIIISEGRQGIITRQRSLRIITNKWSLGIINRNNGYTRHSFVLGAVHIWRQRPKEGGSSVNNDFFWLGRCFLFALSDFCWPTWSQMSNPKSKKKIIRLFFLLKRVTLFLRFYYSAARLREVNIRGWTEPCMF